MNSHGFFVIFEHMEKPIIILGAGLSGLSAAWKLAEEGYPVEVIEAESRVGGLATTLNLGDDCRGDLGPHRFHTQKDWILREVEELLGTRMELKTRMTRIYFRGKFFNYPPSPKDILLGLNPLISLKAFGDYLLTSLRKRFRVPDDSSFQSYMVNRFGRSLYNIYFGPYTEKMWGMHPSDISADWAIQRIPLMNLWETLVKTIRFAFNLKIENAHSHSPFLSLFYYPRGGIGTIAERMREKIKGLSGTIHLNSRVVRVKLKGNSVSSVLFVDQRGRGTEIPCQGVISTIPITELVKSLDPPPGEGIREACEKLRFRSVIYLYLILNRKRVGNDHWIYFSDPEFPFSRISEMTNFSSELAPVGKTVLCLEIACWEEDERWNRPGEKPLRESLEALTRVGLVQQEEVVRHLIFRVPYSYPLYTLTYQRNLRLLLDYLGGLPNLITCGRQGLFRYINMDHAIEMGITAAGLFTGKTSSRDEIYSIAQEKVYYG